MVLLSSYFIADGITVNINSFSIFFSGLLNRYNMSSVCQRFPSIKELHNTPDVPPPELRSNTTKQGLTEIEEQVESEEESIQIQYEWETKPEEVMDNQKGEFVSGMTPPLPGNHFDRNIITS